MKRERAVAASVLSIALAFAATACGGGDSNSAVTAAASATRPPVASPSAAVTFASTTASAPVTPAPSPSSEAPTAAAVATEAPATQPPVVATQPPPPTVPPPSGQSVTVVANNTKFSPTKLTLPTGATITLTLDNQDVGTAHDIVIYDPGNIRIAETDIEIGPAMSTVTFTLGSGGDYVFKCSVHPQQMKGVITVE